jgi:hypothetical protein
MATDQWSFVVTGQREAASAFRSRSGKIVPILRPVFMNAGRDVRDLFKSYPPQPPRSVYVRTGTLGRRWATRQINRRNVLGVSVYNTTSYAPYVQSSERQVEWLRHWTNTDRNVLREVAPGLVRNISGALIRGFV